MATRIRLRRMGAKKRPFYRVVVADQRSPRDGRFIEIIGKYHPLSEPSLIEIDEERALHWLRVGAQPSNQVRNLMTKIGIWERFVAERPSAAASVRRPERPAKEKLSKKAQAKAAKAATDEKAGAPAEASVAEVDVEPSVEEATVPTEQVEAVAAPTEAAAAEPAEAATLPGGDAEAPTEATAAEEPASAE
jgi:small subunit ribosomal protein S16